MPHALPLYRAAAVRAIERAAFARGCAAQTLMQRAGEAAAALLRQRWPQARRVGVLCGVGNNGGDGYVAALALHRAGLEVVVVMAGEPRSEEAQAACRAWQALGRGVLAADAAWPEVELWVDALLGIGLRCAPEAALTALIERVALQGRPVLALDVPSGIDADTGAAAGCFLPATLTLCFVAAKQGLFTAKGREAAGEVIVEPLGLFDADAGAASALALQPPALRALLPLRRIDSHKGRYGRVLCLGGDTGMEGALVLCAEAAARAGAGSVLAWTRPAAVAALQVRRPEVMAQPVPAAAVQTLAEAICASGAEVLALGPGLGQAAWGRLLFEAALLAATQRQLPLVLDADALNLLASRADSDEPGLARGRPMAVLTPHPGEAARLLGLSTAEVQAERFAAAAALAARFEAVVVLKGAGSLVAAVGETPRLIDAGNPGMASAGMGDVLTGVLAALRAQGLSPFDAACAAALAHAVAGDRAAAGAPRGLLASDLIDALREALTP